VCSAGAILIAEGINVVAKLTKACSSCATGQAGTDNQNFVFTFVGRVDQLHIEAMPIP
jgi:hypothetical protein